MFDDADEDEDPLAVPVPKKSRRSLGNDDPPARSSFGRARKMKKGFSEATDPFEAADEEDPLDVTPPRQRYVKCALFVVLRILYKPMSLNLLFNPIKITPGAQAQIEAPGRQGQGGNAWR